MPVKLLCSSCHRQLYVLGREENVVARCPDCGKELTPQETGKPGRERAMESLLEKLPLTDVGSRERPFYLEEKELLLLGECLMDSILSLGDWVKRSRRQLETEAQEIKRIIAFLEEKGRDPLLRKIEFMMLSSFIRNYHG